MVMNVEKCFTTSRSNMENGHRREVTIMNAKFETPKLILWDDYATNEGGTLQYMMDQDTITIASRVHVQEYAGSYECSVLPKLGSSCSKENKFYFKRDNTTTKDNKLSTVVEATEMTDHETHEQDNVKEIKETSQQDKQADVAEQTEKAKNKTTKNQTNSKNKTKNPSFSTTGMRTKTMNRLSRL
ncbi:hypothetical protein LIER_42800 [Lithospermum erythrorhizon]|uniref:Ig-like domain-containing protein n=1 Tax=Lithospermum erythrorhizon TaxID=34254 RepID=A0AAV3NZB8_LITER